MQPLLSVAVGGAVGSVGRYLPTRALAGIALAGAPLGTLAVNAVGSFLIALLATKVPPDRPVWALLGAGVLGGFTTYSTFNQETLVLLQRGAHASAMGNVALTVLLCLVAGVAGGVLGRAMGG